MAYQEKLRMGVSRLRLNHGAGVGVAGINVSLEVKMRT